jgi:ABC-type multidrug transport system ATPase subunit
MELRITGLSKRYGNGVQALKDVTLTVQPGMFGLLGPNGAGKSTLMRTLATLQDADSGSAAFGEIDVLGDKDAVRRILGYLPQEFGLYPRATAEELLDHLAELKGVPRAGRREVVRGLLRKVNLDDARRRRLGTFSGGMKQRFGIAQALLGDPRLLIVDEPTAGLDPEERRRFLHLLSDLGQDIVVILSTHIVSDVAELCRAMAIIDHGEVVLAGDPLALVEALRGRVWRRVLGPGEAVEPALEMISLRRAAGRVVAHVHAEVLPAPGFAPVEPDLEDVYFLAIRRRGAAAAAQ